MTITHLASEIASREGKKIQVSVGNIRELLAILSDKIIEDPTIIALLIKNGERRKRRGKR